LRFELEPFELKTKNSKLKIFCSVSRKIFDELTGPGGGGF
jgi:hypothetical protein